jgi:hypothetical protein
MLCGGRIPVFTYFLDRSVEGGLFTQLNIGGAVLTSHIDA